MSGLNLRLDASQLEQAKLYFRGIENKIPKLLERTLNKSIRGARTDASKEIRKEVAVKAKNVNKTFKVYKASAKRQKLAAGLESAGRALPLIAYQTRQLKKGVSVNVSKDTGKSVVPHAFIAQMPSGHKGVFQRQVRSEDSDRDIPYTGKSKLTSEQFGAIRGKSKKYALPIKELYGPSVPSIFKRKDLMSRVKVKAQERFNTNFDREMKFLLEKSGRSISYD